MVSLVLALEIFGAFKIQQKILLCLNGLTTRIEYLCLESRGLAIAASLLVFVLKGNHTIIL